MTEPEDEPQAEDKDSNGDDQADMTNYNQVASRLDALTFGSDLESFISWEESERAVSDLGKLNHNLLRNYSTYHAQ